MCEGSLPPLVSMAGHDGSLCSAHSSGPLNYACIHSDHGSVQSECSKMISENVEVGKSMVRFTTFFFLRGGAVSA